MHIRFQVLEEHQARFVEALLFDFTTRRKNKKINREDSSSNSSCGKHCVLTLLFPLTCASSSGSSCSGWLLLLNKSLLSPAIHQLRHHLFLPSYPQDWMNHNQQQEHQPRSDTFFLPAVPRATFKAGFIFQCL